jgi:hypothetical protein
MDGSSLTRKERNESRTKTSMRYLNSEILKGYELNYDKKSYILPSASYYCDCFTPQRPIESSLDMVIGVLEFSVKALMCGIAPIDM